MHATMSAVCPSRFTSDRSGPFVISSLAAANLRCTSFSFAVRVSAHRCNGVLPYTFCRPWCVRACCAVPGARACRRAHLHVDVRALREQRGHHAGVRLVAAARLEQAVGEAVVVEPRRPPRRQRAADADAVAADARLLELSGGVLGGCHGGEAATHGAHNRAGLLLHVDESLETPAEITLPGPPSNEIPRQINLNRSIGAGFVTFPPATGASRALAVAGLPSLNRQAQGTVPRGGRRRSRIMADSNFGKWFETVKAQREASAGGSSAAGADSGRGSGRSGLSSLAFWSSGDGDAGAGAGGGKDPESGGLLGSFSLSGRRSEEKKSMCGCCEMTRGQRMQSCVVLVLAGTALMAVALFLFLPFVSCGITLSLWAPIEGGCSTRARKYATDARLVACTSWQRPAIPTQPTKFSLCFTVGSMMYMGAFAMLQGPSAYVRHLVSRDRWLFSSAYLGSMSAWCAALQRPCRRAVPPLPPDALCLHSDCVTPGCPRTRSAHLVCGTVRWKHAARHLRVDGAGRRAGVVRPLVHPRRVGGHEGGNGLLCQDGAVAVLALHLRGVQGVCSMLQVIN